MIERSSLTFDELIGYPDRGTDKEQVKYLEEIERKRGQKMAMDTSGPAENGDQGDQGLPFTGEDLYIMYEEEMDQAGTSVDVWEDLEELDHAAWNSLALRLQRKESFGE